jgi:hypothetical protein
MRVELNQQKNGVFARACRWMKSIAAALVSSSIGSGSLVPFTSTGSLLPVHLGADEGMVVIPDI